MTNKKQYRRYSPEHAIAFLGQVYTAVCPYVAAMLFEKQSCRTRWSRSSSRHRIRPMRLATYGARCRLLETGGDV